jgi:hypothetical protein
MPVKAGLTDNYRRDVLRGKFRDTDRYRMAIYTEQADLHPSHTMQYTPRGEVEGEGYPRGGPVLTGFMADLYGPIATLDFDNPTLDPSTISGRAILIYNDSLPGKDAVYIGDLGREITSVDGPWTPGFPPPEKRGATTSLIQW